MTQFFVVGSAECKGTSRTNFSAAPVSQFIPADPRLNKPHDKPVSASVNLVQASYTTIATLSASVLFDLVNTHRKEINLPAFEQDKDVCSVATSRRDEIVREIFVTGVLHAGFYAKNLPYFATENLIWQHSEAEALSWWLNSPIHRSAIEGNYKYACGVCNGEVCNMVFTNYEKKIATSGSFLSAKTGKPKE